MHVADVDGGLQNDQNLKKLGFSGSRVFVNHRGRDPPSVERQLSNGKEPNHKASGDDEQNGGNDGVDKLLK